MLTSTEKNHNWYKEIVKIKEFSWCFEDLWVTSLNIISLSLSYNQHVITLTPNRKPSLQSHLLLQFLQIDSFNLLQSYLQYQEYIQVNGYKFPLK